MHLSDFVTLVLLYGVEKYSTDWFYFFSLEKSIKWRKANSLAKEFLVSVVSNNSS